MPDAAPRIVHLSTFDAGGAARAAARLHRGLLAEGCASEMLVARTSGSGEAGVRPIAFPGDWPSRLRRRARRDRLRREFSRHAASRPTGYERFSDDRAEYGDTLAALLPPCDVLHLHWVAGLVDYGAFLPAAARGAPLVWTLHDMNPFTGGCHYDLGCGKHKDGCGACPQLGSGDPRDLSRRVWERKKKALDAVPADRLRIVAPSAWLAAEAAGSALLGRFRVDVVPNGLDLDAFAPRDRRSSREILGIPADARVLLFAAESAAVLRKGAHLLARALGGIRDVAGLCLVSLGYDAPPIEAPVAQVRLGYLAQDRLLSAAYSAADLHVVPSLQDNLPNTVLESLACGTPVAAFAVGGIPDMVRPGKTGFLAPAGDADGLRDALIAGLERRDDSAAMRAECRRVAEQEYAAAVQARRCVALYGALRSPKRTGR